MVRARIQSKGTYKSITFKCTFLLLYPLALPYHHFIYITEALKKRKLTKILEHYTVFDFPWNYLKLFQ